METIEEIEEKSVEDELKAILESGIASKRIEVFSKRGLVEPTSAPTSSPTNANPITKEITDIEKVNKNLEKLLDEDSESSNEEDTY